MIPTEYGLTATSPEAYAAIAVEDLLRHAGKKALHTDGELTMEYLGMLSLYAIRRSLSLFPKDEPYYGLMELSYKTFDPDNMSDNYIRCMTDLIKGHSEEPDERTDQP